MYLLFLFSSYNDFIVKEYGMLIYVVILAAFFGAIGQYLDKHLANLGISKKDYFYYMCSTNIWVYGIIFK